MRRIYPFLLASILILITSAMSMEENPLLLDDLNAPWYTVFQDPEERGGEDLPSVWECFGYQTINGESTIVLSPVLDGICRLSLGVGVICCISSPLVLLFLHSIVHAL